MFAPYADIGYVAQKRYGLNRIARFNSAAKTEWIRFPSIIRAF